MLKQLIFLALSGITIVACNNFKRGEGDMQYQIIEDHAGNNIKKYDFISIDLTEQTEDGKTITKTKGYDSRSLLFYNVDSYFQGDIFSAISHLSEGDSAIIKINVDSLKLKMHYQTPKNYHGKYLTYHIRINKVITRGNLTDSQLNARIEGLKASEVLKAKELEPEKIRSYLKAKKLNPDSTKSGLFYLVNKPGKGDKARSGNSIAVNYKITTLDGKVMETNIKSVALQAGIYHPKLTYKPYKSTVTESPSSGFQEALTLFSENAEATVIIPSKLAYHENGKRLIGPYTPLICELKIVSINR